MKTKRQAKVAAPNLPHISAQAIEPSKAEPVDALPRADETPPPADAARPEADDAELHASQRRAQEQSRIRDEAYRIAEERGFPENQAMDHWLEAEARFRRKTA